MDGITNFQTVITVTTAAPVVYDGTLAGGKYNAVNPCVVKAVPGSGGTLLVEYRVFEADSWAEWDGGTVSAATTYRLAGPVNALRFTAAAANGVVGVSQ